MSVRAVIVFITISVGLRGVARAQSEVEVVYRHYTECKSGLPANDGCTLSVTKRVDPGGTLRLRVTETLRDYFKVEVRGYTAKSPEPPVATAGLEDLSKPPDQNLSNEITHNPKYGGYIFTISPIKDLPNDGDQVDPKDAAKGTLKVPGPAVVIVTIDAEEPAYAFSGGISLTSIRNEAFVARPGTTTGSFKVSQDDSRRDAGTVGFATFISVRPFKKQDFFWPGIGIGLETGGNTQYYFGLGFKLARGIFVNTGAVLGQVVILPAGLQEGDVITDPNQLTNLDHRKKFGIYAGMSFKFLGGGQEAFGKPFLGAAGAPK